MSSAVQADVSLHDLSSLQWPGQPDQHRFQNTTDGVGASVLDVNRDRHEKRKNPWETLTEMIRSNTSSDTETTGSNSSSDTWKRAIGNVLDPSTSDRFNTFCRAQSIHNDTWQNCRNDFAAYDFAAFTQEARRQPKSHRGPKNLNLQPQACLDSVGTGKWKLSDANLPNDVVGSHSRYAGKDFYLGPPSALNAQPVDVRSTPHSPIHTEAFRQSELAGTPEFQWVPSGDMRNCPFYEWQRKTDVENCLGGSWIAFWGDSTSRIAFAALVSFLGGGIYNAGFPTHDFTYKEHYEKHDHCFEGTRCHLAVHMPGPDTLITYNFVTTVASYPDVWSTLRSYTNKTQFPGISWPRLKPDIIVMNSGPWEYYGGGGLNPNIYAVQLKDFLGKVVSDAGESSSLDQQHTSTKLVIMRNTACPQNPGNCESSHMTCVDAMDEIHKLQQRILSEFQSLSEVNLANVRLLDGSYVKNVPEQYKCLGETGYHLPAVITDLRINHALYAMCTSSKERGATVSMHLISLTLLILVGCTAHLLLYQL